MREKNQTMEIMCEDEQIAVRMPPHHPFSQRDVQSTGGVLVWVRTDSPATPLPKQLIASTTSSNYLMRVVGRRRMGFSLMAKV